MHVTSLRPLGVPRLGVNIDHVATLRQARGGTDPDPIAAAVIAESAGADGITVHLREDRRHIQERDVRLLRGFAKHLNLELAVDPTVVAIAADVAPHAVCLVPERRAEVTTEGGLDCTQDAEGLAEVVQQLAERGSQVSIFIDPDVRQLQAAQKIGAHAVELHTGTYANARTRPEREMALDGLRFAAVAGGELGLRVYAGHGLTLDNVAPIARLDGVEELNIGHAIVSRAVLVGLDRAVREMRSAIATAVSGAPFEDDDLASEGVS